MSLCDSCKYQYYVEQLKPCIIYRDDCEFYEADEFHEEPKTEIEFDEEQEQLDFVQPRKSTPVTLTVKSSDLISRQTVLDLIKNKYGMLSHPEVISKFIKLEEEINDIHPVTPTERIGHWIIYDVHGHKACKCSKCDKDVGYPCNYKYCPYCGHRMLKPQESEE